ncbi:hypothetical protein Ga0609869_001067 [Rhodovulum iodosum]|uniref:Excinuclease ABC subunit B n=1 Tax=Rhodovulum iodosum TaxID=68291 RepID=A0ABV3XRM0_9RHOB|nr:hypothetical protein [Rhodovulum robiginosum]RSK32863.1 hypothetical protein EJA01_11065 [Rhodovulum robiginosum]
MRALALCALALLGACATPRELCEADALRELRVIDALASDTEATLARGYGLEREPVSVWRMRPCPRRGKDGRIYSGFCQVREVEMRTRPAAVDLAAERRKLAGLKEKRTELARRAARDLAICRKTYPEVQRQNP